MKNTVENGANVADNKSRHDGAQTPAVPLTTTPADRGRDGMADSDFSTGKAPAFQFYPNDFLSDANVVAMSLQERGAYITLICLCWQQGSLPADAARLARLCGAPLNAFRRLWPALETCFRADSSADGRLIHPRLERERQKQAIYRRRQSDNGRHGGRPKKPEQTHGKPTGFSGETQTKPKESSSSSVFNLQSSDCSQKSSPRGSGGVMAGTLPRDHIRHAFCGRKCVPDFLHGEFVSAIGGADPDAATRRFYTEVMASIPDDQPIGDEPLKFWRAQFAGRFGSAAPSGKTAGNVAALTRWLARGETA